MAATAATFSVVMREVGLAGLRPLHEERDRRNLRRSRRAPALERSRAVAAAARGNSRSPRTCSGSRLVASTVRPGLAARSVVMSAAAASTRSQLSRTSSSRLGARKLDKRLRGGAGRRPPARRGSVAIVGTTRAGSVSGERSTKTTPSGKASPISTATAIASRVLPLPPAPVKVTNRTSSRLQDRAQGLDLRLAPDEAGQGRWHGEKRRPRTVRRAAPQDGRSRRGQQRRSGLRSDLQRVGQHAHGFEPRGGTGAALQVADAAHAEAAARWPAPPGTATPRCATGEAGHRTMLGSRALAASSPS